MSSSTVALLLLTFPAAFAFPVYDVEEGPGEFVNEGRGTAFNSVAALDSTRAIECFTDYGSGGGAGTCVVVNVQQDKTVDVAQKYIFANNETHGISVAAFSDKEAVVCYSDKGVTGRLICTSLAIDLGNNQITSGESKIVDAVAFEVPHLDVTTLTHEIGVLCWSEPDSSVKDRAGACNKLTIAGGGALHVSNKSYFDSTRSTTDISVTRFSDVSAIICWSAQGEGNCRQLSLDDNGDNEFSFGDEAVFNVKDSNPSAPVEFEGLEVVSFTETQGMVCYAEKKAQNSVNCKVLVIGETAELTVGEKEEVNGDPSSWLTAVALTEGGALVCYATSPDGAVTNTDSFDGLGTCNIVGLTDGNTTVGAGPPNQVNSQATQHMSVAVLDPIERSAVLCYSDKGAGGALCKALRMAETTTSTTATTTSSATTTSPHTTTETTTTTESSTTSFHTTTQTFTTTSPHTTTNTDSEDSGSASQVLGASVVVAIVLISLMEWDL
jgi:hypothetical protein